MAGPWLSKASGNGPSERLRTAFVEAAAEDRCRRKLAASPHTQGDTAEREALRGRRNHPYKS